MGRPYAKRTIESFIEQRISKVESGCWEWTGSRDPKGYGCIWGRDLVSGKRRPMRATRVMYLLHHGVVPLRSDLYICHRCDNPTCVNPDHLFAGTPKENNEDMYRKGRSRHAVGSAVGASRLSAEQVLAIRERAGTTSARSLAREFGVSHPAINDVINRKTWRHI